MNLNIGSGLYPPPSGWLNVDLNEAETHVASGGWPWSVDDPNPGVQWQIDIVGDCRNLPVDDGSVDRIFFGHVLEHLSYNVDAVQALHEAFRVLRIGGKVGVVGPAMDYALAMDADDQLIEDIGYCRGERWAESDKVIGFAHLWEADSENTLTLVQSVFSNAKIVPVTEISSATDWPTTNAGVAQWQVAVLASKVAL